MFYRVKQFFFYFTCKLTNDDKKFVDKHLNSNQKKLFYKLKIYEQKHSINVARDVEKKCTNKKVKNKESVVLAALLHDVGKIGGNLNLMDKSAMVILNKLSNGKLKKYNNIKKIDVYYNHPEKGYNMLKNLVNDNKVLYLVKNHHNKNIQKNFELNILKESDDKN